MFSRLEYRIREESAKLIRKKKGSISAWKQRAAWEILPGRPSGYYRERNSVAHGGSFINPVIMPNVITELKRLYRILKA